MTSAEQYMSITYAEECKAISFEELRWNFYQVFKRDCREEKDGLLLTEYLQTMKFRSVPLDVNCNVNITQQSLVSADYFTTGTNKNEENDEPARTKPLVISENFQSLYNNVLYSDFTIRFMKQGKEVNHLHVHKLILIQFSDYFKNMFSLGMIESNSNELTVDTEEEREHDFCRMIQAVYDPRILFKDMFLNYDLILLFDKYGFDSHRRTLIENILRTGQLMFFQYMNNNSFVYELVVKDNLKDLIQAVERNFNVFAYLQDFVNDLVVRYVKQSNLNEFQWQTFVFLLSRMDHQQLKGECTTVALRRFPKTKSAYFYVNN